MVDVMNGAPAASWNSSASPCRASCTSLVACAGPRPRLRPVPATGAGCCVVGDAPESTALAGGCHGSHRRAVSRRSFRRSRVPSRARQSAASPVGGALDQSSQYSCAGLTPSARSRSAMAFMCFWPAYFWSGPSLSGHKTIFSPTRGRRVSSLGRTLAPQAVPTAGAPIFRRASVAFSPSARTTVASSPASRSEQGQVSGRMPFSPRRAVGLLPRHVLGAVVIVLANMDGRPGRPRDYGSRGGVVATTRASCFGSSRAGSVGCGTSDRRSADWRPSCPQSAPACGG